MALYGDPVSASSSTIFSPTSLLMSLTKSKYTGFGSSSAIYLFLSKYSRTFLDLCFLHFLQYLDSVTLTKVVSRKSLPGIAKIENAEAHLLRSSFHGDQSCQQNSSLKNSGSILTLNFNYGCRDCCKCNCFHNVDITTIFLSYF